MADTDNPVRGDEESQIKETEEKANQGDDDGDNVEAKVLGFIEPSADELINVDDDDDTYSLNPLKYSVLGISHRLLLLLLLIAFLVNHQTHFQKHHNPICFSTVGFSRFSQLLLYTC